MAIERANLASQSFEKRLQYELSFRLRRGTFPFLSILHSSFYYIPIKNLLSKFLDEDITLLSVQKLNANENLRASFVTHIFNDNQPTPPIPVIFSSKNFSIEEEMPNFNEAKWDSLRSFFKDDLEELNKLILENSLIDKYINREELLKYLR
jgi:hypothetical protein